MLRLTTCDPTLLRSVEVVVTELLARSARLRAEDVMVVGAACRDILQSALRHEFPLRSTADIDFGLAIASWAAYDELTGALPRAGNSGVRFNVAGVPADLMPFGAIEDPPGTVTPAARREPMSVWGFLEVFEAALPLLLPGGTTIRIPTVAGYAALKLAAWLDRSDYGEYKDASDIATALYWYLNSPAIDAQLYETEHGQDLLSQEGLDESAAAARLLGEEIGGVIGFARKAELAERWPGPRADLLYHSMTVVNAPNWPSSSDRRQALIRAMDRGLGLAGTQ